MTVEVGVEGERVAEVVVNRDNGEGFWTSKGFNQVGLGWGEGERKELRGEIR